LYNISYDTLQKHEHMNKRKKTSDMVGRLYRDVSSRLPKQSL